MARLRKLSPDEQGVLDNRLYGKAKQGNTRTVQTLLAMGANVHAGEDSALRIAAFEGHAETVRVLLAAGADVHARDDLALRWATDSGDPETVRMLLAAGADAHACNDEAMRCAVFYGKTEIVNLLAKHIFAPEFWHGKSRTEIEAQAEAVYDKVKARNPRPEYLQQAGHLLVDYALQCWEQVRPAPPKLRINPLPARPRPL